MFSLIAGAIPLITKGVQKFFEGKKEKRDQEFELKKIEVEYKAKAEMAGQVANAEAIKAEMEAKKIEWEFHFSSLLKTFKTISNASSSIVIIRPPRSSADIYRPCNSLPSVVVSFQGSDTGNI